MTLGVYRGRKTTMQQQQSSGGSFFPSFKRVRSHRNQNRKYQILSPLEKKKKGNAGNVTVHMRI